MARKPVKPKESLAIIPAAKQEQIRKLLLEDTRHGTVEGKDTQLPLVSFTKIAFDLNVPISVVRSVAKTMQNELRALDMQREQEFQRELLGGAKAALAQVIEAIEKRTMSDRQLIYAAGVLTDKYLALKASQSPQTTTLTLTGSTDDLAVSIGSILQKAADRRVAIDAEVIEETEDTESD